MSFDSRAMGRLVELFGKVIKKCRTNNAERMSYPAAIRSRCGMELLEQLEPRMMLSVSPTVVTAIDDMTVDNTTGAVTIDVSGNFWDNDLPDMITGVGHENDIIYAFQSNMGTIYVQMFNGYAPGTVTNFSRYAGNDLYDGSVIHRSIADFIVQGGGFIWDDTADYPVVDIPTYNPIDNEFGISNTRGTIAMAKLGGDPDSATSQWFFNLGDNSDNLDNQNGGFTVFGEVIGNGMDVVDAIAALNTYLPTYTYNSQLYMLDGAFTDTPLQNMDGVDQYQVTYNGYYYDSCDATQLTADNFVQFSSIDAAMTYSITNVTNENLLASYSIDPLTGELKFKAAAGAVGQTDFTITATDYEGNSVSDTFTVKIDAKQVLDPGQKFTYTDVDGDLVTISFKGKQGQAEVTVTSEGIIQLLDLAETTTAESIDITVKKGAEGDGRVGLAEVLINGSLKSFTGKTADLVFDFGVAGVVNKIQLGNVNGSMITLNGDSNDPDAVAPKGVTLQFDSVAGSSVNTNGVGISKLDVLEWIGGYSAEPNIAAGWLGSMNVKGQRENIARGIIGLDGDFIGNVNITGADAKGNAIKSIKVAGSWNGDLQAFFGYVSSVQAGAWDGLLAVDSLGKFATKSSKTNADIDGHAVGNFAIMGCNARCIAANDINIAGLADGLTVTADLGIINKITVGNWVGGSVRTMALNSLTTKAFRGSDTVAGNLGIDVTLDPDAYDGGILRSVLGKVSVAGSLVGNLGNSAEWDITGPVGKVSVKGDAEDQAWHFYGTLAGLDVKGTANNIVVSAETEIKSITLGAVFDSDFGCGVNLEYAGDDPTIVDFADAGVIGSFTVKGLKVPAGEDIPDFFGDTFIHAGNIKKVTLLNVSELEKGRIYVPDDINNVASLTIKDTRTKQTISWKAGKTLPDEWADPDDCPIKAIEPF